MTKVKGLGEQAILNRIKKINDLMAQIQMLNEEVEKLKGELKTDLDTKGLDTLPVGHFTLWYQTSQRNTTDTTKLKETYEALCDKYNEEKKNFVKVSDVRSFRITEHKH